MNVGDGSRLRRCEFDDYLLRRAHARLKLTDWMPSPLRLFAARWLMTSRWFARRVLLDRWFLHTDQTPLFF